MKKINKKNKIKSALMASAIGGGISLAVIAQQCGGNVVNPTAQGIANQINSLSNQPLFIPPSDPGTPSTNIPQDLDNTVAGQIWGQLNVLANGGNSGNLAVTSIEIPEISADQVEINQSLNLYSVNVNLLARYIAPNPMDGSVPVPQLLSPVVTNVGNENSYVVQLSFSVENNNTSFNTTSLSDTNMMSSSYTGYISAQVNSLRGYNSANEYGVLATEIISQLNIDINEITTVFSSSSTMTTSVSGLQFDEVSLDNSLNSESSIDVELRGFSGMASFPISNNTDVFQVLTPFYDDNELAPPTINISTSSIPFISSLAISNISAPETDILNETIAINDYDPASGPSSPLIESIITSINAQLRTLLNNDQTAEIRTISISRVENSDFSVSDVTVTNSTDYDVRGILINGTASAEGGDVTVDFRQSATANGTTFNFIFTTGEFSFQNSNTFIEISD